MRRLRYSRSRPKRGRARYSVARKRGRRSSRGRGRKLRSYSVSRGGIRL